MHHWSLLSIHSLLLPAVFFPTVCPVVSSRNKTPPIPPFQAEAVSFPYISHTYSWGRYSSSLVCTANAIPSSSLLSFQKKHTPLEAHGISFSRTAVTHSQSQLWSSTTTLWHHSDMEDNTMTSHPNWSPLVSLSHHFCGCTTDLAFTNYHATSEKEIQSSHCHHSPPALASPIQTLLP